MFGLGFSELEMSVSGPSIIKVFGTPVLYGNLNPFVTMNLDETDFST